MTLFLAGYVSGYYPVAINDHDPSMSIKIGRVRDAGSPIVGVLKGIGIMQPGLGRPLLTPFKPHLSHPANQVEASLHRFGRLMESPDGETQKRLYRYAVEYIRRAWPRTLRSEDVPTVREWLDNCNYPGGRRLALEKLRVELYEINQQSAIVKAFIKDEGYDEPKIPRAINSYVDESKTILGALTQAVDKMTFGVGQIGEPHRDMNPGTRHFVKGTNPRDWPSKLEEVFGESKVQCTDFSSFEAHHSGVYARIVNYWYLHMVRNIKGIRPIKDLVSRMMLGRNIIRFRDISVEIDQRLMSGALWTSSANGVLNLILMGFLSMSAKHKDADPETLAALAIRELRGFVEGDDGICEDLSISKQLIKKMGLVLKMKHYPSYDRAGFCGIVCDRASGVVLKDPIPVLRKFFFLPQRYVSCSEKQAYSLYRARALSYMCNFGSCPIIGPLCQWVCELTRSYDARGGLSVLDSYHRTSAETAIHEHAWKNDYKISLESRTIVEEEFGIPIDEQIRIEKALTATRGPLAEVDLSHYAKTWDIHHSHEYVVTDTRHFIEPNFNLRPITHGILKDGLVAQAKSEFVKKMSRVRVSRLDAHSLDARVCQLLE